MKGCITQLLEHATPQQCGALTYAWSTAGLIKLGNLGRPMQTLWLSAAKDQDVRQSSCCAETYSVHSIIHTTMSEREHKTEHTTPKHNSAR